MAAFAFGPFGAFVVAAALVPARSVVTPAAIVLALAAVIALADAAGGIVPATMTAITAALSFNFFHLEPYRSLHLHSVGDAVTTGLLVALGPVLAARRRLALHLHHLLRHEPNTTEVES